MLALTVHEDKGYLRQLVQAGASGYLLKRAASQDLLHAIRAVAAGGTYLDPALAGEVLGGFVGKRRAGARSGTDELSEREAEVVRLIARGFSNKEIAAQLDLSSKTVETYKARSLEKLGLSSRSDLVSYALQARLAGALSLLSAPVLHRISASPDPQRPGSGLIIEPLG